jgi:2-polyprenyl-3-methyl-5-hydroxy-6-metoxy-1,4-benzoquinol methylase
MNDPTLSEYAALFSEHGLTDTSYLESQYQRYCSTKRRLESEWRGGSRLLDVGAHWLHQALLYARDGYAVTAADLPITLQTPSVRSLARCYGVTLLEYSDLETTTAFRQIPDNSFDVILFTEIIEHITFNPVTMWRELYRVLSEGGRIVVTTPNYYSIDGRLWSPRRLVGRLGGGITVREIITEHTHGHHWKEFSLRELCYYFKMLSPDFEIHKALCVDDFSLQATKRRFGKTSRALGKVFPGLRPNLHIEVDLTRKEHGIVVTPSW